MQIRYTVYYRDYWTKKAEDIGFFIDFWKEIDFRRGRTLALKHFGHLVKDRNALFVLAEKVNYAKGGK